MISYSGHSIRGFKQCLSFSAILFLLRYYETWHNDNQYDDTQNKMLICDTQHPNTVVGVIMLVSCFI